jgi:hypothetical protein
MQAIITPEKIELPPGTVVRMLGTWQDYQKLEEQLGESRYSAHQIPTR